MNCLFCGVFTNNPKYCSKSCSAKVNNKGVRRHGFSSITSNCLYCQNSFTKQPTNPKKYCDNKCQAAHQWQKYFTEDEKKNAKTISNRIYSARYRSKWSKKLDETADKTIIKLIYKNKPEGYDVDHIVPLTRGGIHHENNLQYMETSDNKRKNNRLEEECDFPLRIIKWQTIIYA